MILFFILAPWEQERRIIGMVKSPMKGNQLVLIKMESAVIYSDFVRPVCLARDHEAWISGPTSRCLFLGWGKDRQFSLFELNGMPIAITSLVFFFIVN